MYDEDELDKTPITGDYDTAVALHHWHSGQGDPIYMVGSLWYSDRPAPKYLVEGALRWLRSDLSKRKGRRDADTRELRGLVAELTRMVEAPKPRRARRTRS